MQMVAATPKGSPSSGTAREASRPATPTVRRETTPAATGLSVRPAIRSRSASSQSFTQPTESWVAPIAAATPSTLQPRWPAPMASRVMARVTAPPGSGWEALSRVMGPDMKAVWCL
jgi:hypothetical protein